MADEKPERDDSQRSSSSGRGASRPPHGSRPARSGQSPRDGQRKTYTPREGDRKPYVPRDGERKSYPPRDGDRKPYAPRDGDRKPYAPRDGQRKSYPPRDGERKSYPPRDGERKSYAPRDGERKSYPPRDGDRKPYVPRDGDRKSYPPRDGERKSYPPRDGERKSYPPRDGQRKSYPPRDGDRKPYVSRDGERKPYAPRDGQRKSYPPRDGDRKPYVPRDGDRKPYQKREHAPRAGADRAPRDPVQDALRSVRPRHDDPVIPDEVTASDLSSSARNELKTLSKENAEWVARHLAMASSLIEDDPELAHQHALSASRRAGRIGIVRETLAITAYATGDYALALRELRTYRRISGKDDQIALMVDSERGVGRPDRALEVGRAVDRATLPASVRVELAIAMSGARLDLDDPARALTELDIPELDPDRAFEWSPGLFAARAAVLEELDRTEEAAQWQQRAIVAAEALHAASGLGDLETIEIEEIFETPQDEATVASGETEVAGPDAVDDQDQDQDQEPEAAGPEAVPDQLPGDVEEAETEPQAADHGAAPAHTPDVSATGAFTIEDEVDEILAEAGIDDDEEGVDD